MCCAPSQLMTVFWSTWSAGTPRLRRTQAALQALHVQSRH